MLENIGFTAFKLPIGHFSTNPSLIALRSLSEKIAHRKFGSETPSFYDGFTVKY
ncbi:unknown protein [Microcystis aeruginosa NIES-843]|uniref:Uncharacterized protein n=1 Tax=Microcystis aeruginosa (strain NIES-843 / IAM M-2473) TaxID=449447 RepID=B0JTP7_MICAN|nr:unknown protein [Microcystis aeruginosa NIES-843]